MRFLTLPPPHTCFRLGAREWLLVYTCSSARKPQDSCTSTLVYYPLLQWPSCAQTPPQQDVSVFTLAQPTLSNVYWWLMMHKDVRWMFVWSRVHWIFFSLFIQYCAKVWSHPHFFKYYLLGKWNRDEIIYWNRCTHKWKYNKWCNEKIEFVQVGVWDHCHATLLLVLGFFSYRHDFHILLINCRYFSRPVTSSFVLQCFLKTHCILYAFLTCYGWNCSIDSTIPGLGLRVLSFVVSRLL